MQPKVNDIELPEIKQFTDIELPNGMTMHLLSGGTQPVVKIDIYTLAGTTSAAKPCVAKTTAELLQEGTLNLSAKQFAEQIDFLGAYLSASASTNYAHISVLCLAKHLAQIADLVSDMLTKPLFGQDEFDIYIDRASQEFKINEQKTSYLARRELLSMLFAEGCRYGRIAHLDDWKKLTLSDVRDFYNKQYTPQGSHIFISGLPSQTDIDTITAAFGQRWAPKPTVFEHIEPIANHKTERRHVAHSNAQQASLAMGLITIKPSDPDFYCLSILTTLLGGYFGSRLMSNLREDKGLTYGIGANLQSNEKYSRLGIYSDLKPDSVDFAINEIFAEIKRLQTEPVGPDELNTLTSYVKGEIIRSLDNTITTANTLSQLMLCGFAHNYNEQLFDTCNTITPDEIMRLANKYLACDKFNIVTCF
ncbi:MAG: insulinase family protein [Bacteroidales bacterium]|nr:insulinase family protein [Bacteroidales bacterium]